MTLTVFGATGRTGRHVVDQALAAGHTVVAFARTPSKLTAAHPKLTVVEGTVSDRAAIERAVAGADAVVLALSPEPKSGIEVTTTAARHVVAAMQASGVRRIVSLTGAGVADARDPAYWGARLVRGIMGVVAAPILRDAAAHADVLRAAQAAGTIDATIVRAPRLTDGPATGRIRSGYLEMGLGHQIARADVAAVMLRMATSGEGIGEAPMVTSTGA